MKKTTLLAALFLTAPASLSMGSFALAQDSDGADAPGATPQDAGPPPVGEPKSYTLPAVETYTLRNGMQVTLAKLGGVPKTTIRAVTRVGNLNDGKTPWISDLTADMLKEGAGGKSAAALATAAAQMGGDVNVSVGLDQTTVAMDVLSEAAGEATALIADILQRPDFPAAEFERVKTNRLRDLSVAASQPGTIATAAFSNIVYPDHPYAAAVLPDPEGVGAITLENVQKFHAENFGAARTHLYVAGNFDKRTVKRAIRQAFRKWDSGPALLSAPPGDSAGPQIVLIDRPGAVQSTIRLGKRVPSIDENVDLSAANTMLGGYFSSRITRNIREDKGYTYSPRSRISLEAGAAYWNQIADITSEATGPALVEIVKEITDLVKNPPAANELQGVQNYMNGVFVIRLASRGGMANQLAFVNLHGLGLDYLEKYVGRVSALTPESVHEAAKNHLDVADMSLVVVGDIASVRSQLESVPAFADRLPSDDAE